MTPRPLRPWLAICALCALTLLAYGNSFENGFTLDNHFFVIEDSRVHKATLENLSLIVNHSYWWPQGEAGLYRPLTSLSYLFNYAILGNADRPAGYHWMNLLLHAANVLLVFFIARRLVAQAPDEGIGREGFLFSFLTAALWAVHPVLTESVTNIVGRADLLAGVALLGGLLVHLRSTETSGWRRVAWLAGLTAVTAAGVFSKESAVAVLGVVALYELTWWSTGRWRGFLFSCVAMCPAFLAMLWMRSRVLATSAPSVWPFVDNPIMGAGFWIGRLTAVKVMAKYLGLLIWPATLSVDYSYRQIPLADGRLTDWIAWIVVASAAIGVAYSYRRNKVVFFAAGFSFLTLLPASNLIVPVGTIMADRFLYLPAIGFSICLTLALYAMVRRFHPGALAPLVLGLCITAGFAARTWARNPDWKDNLTLWSVAVQTSPLSFKTHSALAQLDSELAISEDERSLALLDSLPDSLNDALSYLRTARHYILKGDNLRQRDQDGKLIIPPESASAYEKAKSLLLRALSILAAHQAADIARGPGFLRVPGDPRLIRPNEKISAYLMLSEVDRRLGNAPESLRWGRQAQTAGPLVAEVYAHIHDVLLAMGRRDEAMATLMEGEVLTSDPALQQRLVADYADNPAAARCAISYAQAAPQIDFSCATVRQRVCSVSAEVLRLGLKAGGPDMAARLRNELAEKYGCGQPARAP